MKTADIETGPSRLYHAWKAFRARWETSQEVWNDAARREFERNHLEPLEQQVQATLKDMDRLAQSLSRALRECT